VPWSILQVKQYIGKAVNEASNTKRRRKAGQKHQSWPEINGKRRRENEIDLRKKKKEKKC
jgi:hypothetical protein